MDRYSIRYSVGIPLILGTIGFLVMLNSTLDYVWKHYPAGYSSSVNERVEAIDKLENPN